MPEGGRPIIMRPTRTGGHSNVTKSSSSSLCRPTTFGHYSLVPEGPGLHNEEDEDYQGIRE